MANTLQELLEMGRKTASVQRSVSVATSSTTLSSAAPNRIALIISAPPTNRFTVSLSSTAVLDQGITLYPTTNTLVLTLRDHGELVTRSLTAISATATQTVNVVEVYASL